MADITTVKQAISSALTAFSKVAKGAFEPKDATIVHDASYVHTDSNYTAAEKTKLAGIAAGAEVNALESVRVNGTALAVTDRAVDVSVPTKTSDLTNDSDFAVDASYVHTDSNYTAAEKTKLSGIAAGAQANVIEGVTVNGTAATVSGKVAAITVPTDNASLANGAGYQTATQVESAIAGRGYQTAAQVTTAIEGYGYQTASQVTSAINTALSTVMDYKGAVASESALPSAGQKVGDTYNVTATGHNFAWSGEAWDDLGPATDISGCVMTADLEGFTEAEVQTIFDAA